MGNGRLSASSDYQILEKERSALSPAPVKDLVPPPPMKSTDDFVARQRQYSLEYKRWRSAVGDLVERAKLSGNKRQQPDLYSLLALSRAVDIALVLDTDNCSCDHLSFEFSEINALAREVIQYRKSLNPDSQFTFEIGVNAALFIAARFCRERKIRREAISLLQMYGIREGLCDGNHSAAMCMKIMELEEEVVETEYIPGSARVRMIEKTVHPEERWSTFHYIRGSEETVRASEFRW